MPALHRSLSSMSTSLLHWGVQHWTQRSKFVSLPLCRGLRINSLDLLAMISLMQPGIPLATFTARAHCWVISNLLSNRTTISFSAKLLSSHSFPSLYWFMGLFLPKCRICHFPLLNSMRLLLGHFSSLPKFLWMAAQPSCISASPSDFVSFADLHSVSSSRSLKMLNSTGSSGDPWDTLLVTGVHLDFFHPVTVLWGWKIS